MTEGGGAHHHEPGLGDLVLPGINFVIFAALMLYILRGPLIEFFRDRAARLRESLDAGATARREAEELRAKLEKDLADLPRLREEMKADLIDTATRQRERMLEAARLASERIGRDAEVVAAQERAAAQAAIRDEIVSVAVREAADFVRGAIGADDQNRFVRDFVEGARAL